MIYITTSRKPGKRTRSFCRELEKVIPLSVYENRGKRNVYEVARDAWRKGYDRVWLVGETKANPSLIRFMEVEEDWNWIGQVYIRVSLARELGRTLQRGDTLLVDVETEVLREAVGYYPPEGEEEVLREKRGVAEFVLGGEVVGPQIRITGVDRVPEKVKIHESEDEEA